MSDFRCPYYFYDGHFKCRLLDNSKMNNLSGYEFEHFCKSRENHKDCPYYKRYR